MECPICFENIFFPKKLQCGHIFHSHCIYKWCDTSNTTCPCCRDRVKEVGLLLSKGSNIMINDINVLFNR
jgi:hypothetical protein